MPVLFGVEVLIQITFAMHVLRNGKDRYWVYIIMIFPMVGCLIYFLMEILPELKHSQQLKKTGDVVLDAMKPDRHIAYWRDQVELTPSVKNKNELAKTYMNSGMFNEALTLYRECLTGIHESDPAIIEGMCLACFFQADYESALINLRRLKKIQKDKNNHEFDLLYARALENLGRTDEALEAYELIQRSFTGEEARCRYACLLERVGRYDDAKNIFQDILKNVRLSAGYYKKRKNRGCRWQKRVLPVNNFCSKDLLHMGAGRLLHIARSQPAFF